MVWDDSINVVDPFEKAAYMTDIRMAYQKYGLGGLIYTRFNVHMYQRSADTRLQRWGNDATSRPTSATSNNRALLHEVGPRPGLPRD